MTEEEKALESKFGRSGHFIAPKNYFDDFNEMLMDKLPERNVKVAKPNRTMWKVFRPALLAAASVCIAIFGVTVYLHTDDASDSVADKMHASHVTSENASGYCTVEQAADCSMLDNEDIYICMTDN